MLTTFEESTLEHARTAATYPWRMLCSTRHGRQSRYLGSHGRMLCTRLAKSKPQKEWKLVPEVVGRILLSGHGSIVQRFADGMLFRTMCVLAIGVAWKARVRCWTYAAPMPPYPRRTLFI